MRAASGCGYQVDVRLAHHITFFGPGHHPTRAFAFCEAVSICTGKLLSLEKRNQQIAATALRQRLIQVTTQALFIQPGLGIAGFGVRE